MKTLPVLLELPVAYYREIGRIAHTCSYIEHVLQMLAYELLNITPVQGRIALRQPRAKETYEMLCELAEQIDITISSDFAVLQSALDKCSLERDKIVHGVWVMGDDGKVYLRVTSGTWQPIKGMKGKTKRRIKPQGVQISLDDCRAIAKVAESTRDAVLAFGKQLSEAISAKRKKT